MFHEEWEYCLWCHLCVILCQVEGGGEEMLRVSLKGWLRVQVRATCLGFPLPGSWVWGSGADTL